MKSLNKFVILLTIGFFVGAIIINISIYLDYVNATGKTKALFGLTLLFKYGYRVYLSAITAILFIIYLIGFFRTKTKIYLHVAIINLISSLLYITGIWRFFV